MYERKPGDTRKKKKKTTPKKTNNPHKTKTTEHCWEISRLEILTWRNIKPTEKYTEVGARN